MSFHQNSLTTCVWDMQAFSNMTVAMRRELCAVMEYKVIERAGTVLYNDGDLIDSWSAILNGCVEVVHSDGRTEELCDRCGIMFCVNCW